MGACTSQNKKGSAEERHLSSSINKELDKDKSTISRHKKILFLGAGGTGKSTVYKQLRQIHGNGFSDDDRKEFIPHIYAQIITQMKSALNVFIDYNLRIQQREKKENEYESNDNDDELLIFDDIQLQSPPITNMESADKLLNYKFNKYQCELDINILNAIQSLWNEAIIKEIYDKRNITKIETSSAHFWNKLDDIKDPSYLPTEEDILLCRLVTTGLHEMTLEVKNDIFNIIDVGGQRSQRRKWIHCFEHVVAVIFIASLSSYDEILHEDTNVNAMVDQLELFEEICNNHSLEKVSMILFLNKTDLFRQKYVKDKIPLNKCPAFSEYAQDGDDPFDYKKGVTFIENQFLELNQSASREIFVHQTCATDKNNIEKVFHDVQMAVISNALMEGGYVDFDED